MANKLKFITNTSVEYFDAVSCQDDHQPIIEFLENEDVTILAATSPGNNGKVNFHHQIPTGDLCLLFYKIPHPNIRTRTIDPTSSAEKTSILNQNVGILTLEGGMIKSIYNSVSRVFSPSAKSQKTEIGSELSGLLENLQSSLSSTLGISQSGIASVKDEIQFWQQKFNDKSNSRIDREMAQQFIAILENINKKMDLIENLEKSEEFLDSSHGSLDDLWRLPYKFPQSRMSDLLDAIGNRLLESCTENLNSIDMWDLNSFHVNNLVSQCLDIVDSWMQVCDALTRLFWPNYEQHMWIGNPYAPLGAQHFRERLLEIRRIKDLYKQIATLLDDDGVRYMFSTHSPFKDFNIFDTSKLGQTKWNKALQYFEQLLEPIDERIAHALKKQLHNHLSNPRQVIYIFSKFDTLIQRPTVLELLTIEREQFLQSLHILLQDLRKAMTDSNMEPDAGHLSLICNECRWLKIVQHQIQEIEKVTHLISGREGFDQINKGIHEIKEETESLLRTNFEIWCNQSLTAVRSGELRLRDDQSVVKFEEEGRQLMRVTFNPKLVTFCQDVREFENLGYIVPADLHSSAVHAAKFMSYARSLQQIATFHNTIGDRMIPCQRPIMLKNAMELSRLVQSRTVAWNDEESVKKYVSTLQTAVAKLSEDNTLLVGYHEQAKRTVIKLMNTDLFTQNQVWKDEMRHLRELLATLERLGYTNLDAFKLHWDHQLYKVLEYQYILGLVDMNSKLPDIHVDIVFRQRTLCFRPPEEEIREKYFTQLRRFIERPFGFRGLSDKSGDLFKSMIELNRHHFGPLFEKSQELFGKLEKFKAIWRPWIALGCVDVDELCNIHLSNFEDWDRNFKECKLFNQSIAKIQNSEECIDCFVINILPLRSDIEFIGRRFWEALANSLRSSILKDISVIQDFLQNSFQFLQNVPLDESSISDSGMKYEKMMNELPQVSDILNVVKGKDTCLAGWCKERVSALAGIEAEWEKLQPLIENHAVILQRQVDMMKTRAQMQIQNLHNEAEKFILRWDAAVAELETNENCTLDLFKERQQNWSKIQQTKSQLVDDCTRFSITIPDNVRENFNQIDEKIQSQSVQWNVFDTFTTELEAIFSEEWTIYRRRPYILNEFLNKWEISVNSSIDLPSQRIRQKVDQLLAIVPILKLLQSDALTERHWAKVFLLLKKDFVKPFHSILLGEILSDSAGLMQISADIENIIREATSEQIVRQALTDLDQWAITATIKLTTHHDSAGNSVSLIQDYQELLNKIGDNQSLLQAAKNSAAFEAFSDQAELWESRLNMLDMLLTSLGQSQRRWIYLEPVFGAGTLKNKNEEALFKRVDKDFRFILREIQTDPRVISISKIGNISTIVNALETQLARCQNNLMSYITDQRKSFPRFYFLGDDDLLEILGQASRDPKIIQKHIQKLFPGCHSLDFVHEEIKHGKVFTIKSIQSAEGDIVILNEPVEITGSIEVWLNKVVTSIQETLKTHIFNCYGGDCEHFQDFVLQKYAIQVLSTSRAIQFTRQAEKAITSMSLQKLLQSLNNEISDLTSKKSKTNDALQRAKLRSLLFDMVHYVSVVEELIQQNVTRTSDWHWLQQMRFYMGGADGRTVLVRMIHGEFEYSYEFLGNTNKLVHTRLTQKCYLILTQAMHMGLGGNPFGPAGTGKTECVKALAAMMGRLVLVFNCDENVDTEAIGLILTGLARCGAWGCFDEFNRLQEATLSAISMLIQPIQMALKDKAAEVVIGEKTVELNQHCGIFVTLNPAGEEYGGRQKLPGNIQALFRPIVMQQPEPKEIARVILFVEGFQRAAEIGDRIVELFDLSSKILSAQHHYDWGLRELKTILLACGQELSATVDDDNMEMSAVVRCLRANTMAKLTKSDIERFDLLLASVFPEIEITTKHSSPMEQAITAAFAPLDLCPNQMQIEKTLQLYEQLIKRTGVVIVGPPGSGKTTIISLLRQALSQLPTEPTTVNNSTNIRIHTISPKSMNRTQLLGKLDPDTRQWTDGVLTTTAVAVNSEPGHIHSWIICDGSIDPEWIEALNSVLDDNKLLTLPSGWRIQFGNNVNFIFETHNVSNASPATISRMGIVNLNKEDFPQTQVVNKFLAKEEFGDILRTFIEEYFLPAAEWIERNYLLHSLPGLDRNCLFRSLFLYLGKGVQTKAHFCICLCKALFGFLPVTRHNELANLIFERSNQYITNPNRAELAFYNAQNETIEFYESEIHIEANAMQSDANLIETAQVKAYLSTLQVFLEAYVSSPFLIVGPSGCGKTFLIQHAVAQCSGYQLITINCSTQLTPAHILHSLKQNCITVSGLRGREYKPKQVRIVLFLKNIDLCYLDSWETSEIVEFLLQLHQRNGVYTSSLEWVNISGIQICGSVSEQNSRLLRISPRFLALNNFLRVQQPSNEDMERIVESRLAPIMAKFKTGTNIQYIVTSILDFYARIQEMGTYASHRYSHYQFNPKNIMKLVKNLKHYPENSFNEALLCEMNAVFKDRMMTEHDASQVDDFIKQTGSMRKLYMQDKTYFVPKSPGRELLHGLSHNEWLEEVQKQMIICNSESFTIDEPITEEFLEQVAKISRIITRSDSHLLLLAQPGGGHIEAIYVAATFQEAKIHVLHGGSNYGIVDFYNDLKMAMQTAALENQCTCLLIDHCWISFCADILKPIEAILEGSEILDLFDDDLESIASSLKHSAQLEGYQESLASYFIERTKRNLHLIVALESSSPILSDLFNTYPALHRNMNCLTVRSMSNATFEMLPKKFIELLSNYNNREQISISSYFSDIISKFVEQQPPKRFFQLIRSYFYIYCQHSQNLEKRLQKLQLGVDKLAAAHNLVDTLKSNAAKQEEALAEKRKLANDALEMISATMRSATDQKSNMLELKKQAQVNSEKLKERQKVIQQELSEVEPILKEASAAVGQIKSEALSEIRSLRAPPEAIRDILEGVLRLMGIRDTSWNSMKTFLAKRGVKEDIRSLDPARINPDNCEAVEKLLATKSDSFELRNAKRASAAAAPLATWVRASVRYSKVIQSIKPLEREQRDLQRNLDMAESEMQSLITGLDDVDVRVKELSARLNAYTQEAAILELKLEDARSTLHSAEVLIRNLSSEFQMWSVQLDEYKSSYKTLGTKSLFISLAINYLSHLSLENRTASLADVTSDLRLAKTFDIRESLLTDQEQIIWESMGLTRDAQVIENAAILNQILELPFNASPIPLLLDPTQTASVWLEEFLRSKNRQFEIISQNNERLAYTLELAIRFGKIIVVNDCHSIRPPLMQLIQGRVFMKFNKKLLEVGSKFVDFHENFRLVMATNKTKINIDRESLVHLTCIPFTVTVVGLTDQLLSKAIVMKNPELEEKRVNNLRNEGLLLKRRLDIEKKLLEELSEAQGDILKNEKLLKTLNEVKESSCVIESSLKESSVIKETLLKDFKQLKVLCQKSATFYIGLSEIYDTATEIFTKLFLSSIQGEKVSGTDFKTAYDVLVRTTFQYLARSTQRSSHLTLAMFICRYAFPEHFPSHEWELFVTNFMNSGDVTDVDIPLPSWIEKESGVQLKAILERSPELATQLQLNKDYAWRTFINEGGSNMPGDVRLSFHRVLIAQIFRPDLITFYLNEVVSGLLGISLDSIIQPTMQQLIDESTSERPILVITQPENDPSIEIRSLAMKKVSHGHFMELSIGRTMERKTLDVIRQAAIAGKWISIRNVHLVPNWLVDLDRELEVMKKADSFRLWLIAESTKGFSDAVQYKFTKILYEFPTGIKHKVLHTMQSYSGSDFTRWRDGKSMKIRISLFIMNAVLLERRRYIPQGWSQWYEFGDSDLRAALDILRWLDSGISTGRPEWKTIRCLCEIIAFGGRINNSSDVRVLQHYLKEFLSSEVLNNRWSPLGVNVQIPTTAIYQDYWTSMGKFPDTDSLETFRLSPQSNISRNTAVSLNIVQELRRPFYHKHGGHNKGSDEFRKLDKQIKPILLLWKKLASKSTVLESANELNETDATVSPWKVFIFGEMNIAVQCFQEIHNTLSNVHSWLKDARLVSLRSADANILSTLAQNQVPLNWRRIWSGPTCTLEYIKAVVVRGTEAERRLHSTFQLDFAAEIDLSTIFNCQAFFCCFKLASSRKLQKSSNYLKLYTSLATKPSIDVCTVKLAPLKVDGAVFMFDKLVVSSNETRNATDKSPQFYISFKEKDDTAHRQGTGSVSLPLYTNVRREKLICEIEVLTSEAADTLLLSGVALSVSDY